MYRLLPYNPSEVTGSLAALVRKDEESGGETDGRTAALRRYFSPSSGRPLVPAHILEDLFQDGTFMIEPHDFAAAASGVLRLDERIPFSVFEGLPTMRKKEDFEKLVKETEVVFTTEDPQVLSFITALADGGKRGKVFLFLVAACLTRLSEEPVRKPKSPRGSQ